MLSLSILLDTLGGFILSRLRRLRRRLGGMQPPRLVNPGAGEFRVFPAGGRRNDRGGAPGHIAGDGVRIGEQPALLSQFLAAAAIGQAEKVAADVQFCGKVEGKKLRPHLLEHCLILPVRSDDCACARSCRPTSQ